MGARRLLQMPSIAPCVHCAGDDTCGLILLCDVCDKAIHAHCCGFRGPLLGDWLCADCAPREESAPASVQ